MINLELINYLSIFQNLKQHTYWQKWVNCSAATITVFAMKNVP